MTYHGLKLYFLIIAALGLRPVSGTELKSIKGILTKLQEKLKEGVQYYISLLTRWLEKFHSRQLKLTDLGFGKKLHLALLPMVFNVGAASMVMMMTAMLTAKSVMVGALVFILKIVFIVAKVKGLISKAVLIFSKFTKWGFLGAKRSRHVSALKQIASFLAAIKLKHLKHGGPHQEISYVPYHTASHVHHDSYQQPHHHHHDYQDSYQGWEGYYRKADDQWGSNQPVPMQ